MRRAIASLTLGLLIVATACEARGESPTTATSLIKSLRAPLKPLEITIVRELQNQGSCDLLAFSQDMTHVAAAMDGTSLVVWDVATGQRTSPPNLAVAERATAISLSSGGKYLLVGHPTQPPELLDVKAGTLIQRYEGIQGEVKVARITADDQTVALLDAGGTLHRFGLRQAKGESRSLGSPSPPTTFAIAADGRSASAGNAQNGVSALVTTDGQRWGTAREPINALGACAIQSGWIAYTDRAKRNLLVRPMAGNDPRNATTALMYLNEFAWMQLTPDARRLATMSHDGLFEVIGLEGQVYRRRANLQRALRCFEFGADGRTMAWSDGGQRTVLARLPDDIVPPTAIVAKTLQAWFANKEYRRLDEVFRQIETDHEPFEWAPNCSPEDALAHMLISPSGDWQAADIDRAIDAWLAAEPDATLPRLFRAELLIQQAWAARGDGYAHTVTQQGWEVFHERIARAAEVMAPLHDLEKPSGHAFSLMFTIAVAASVDSETIEPDVQRLLELHPRAFEPHFVMCQKSMLRWGGAPDALARYAARAADNVGGDAGDELYARLGVSQIRYYPPEEYLGQSGLSLARIIKGLKQLTQRAGDRQAMALYGLWLSHQFRSLDDERWFAERLKNVDLRTIWPMSLRDTRELANLQRMVGITPPPQNANLAGVTSAAPPTPEAASSFIPLAILLPVAAVVLAGLAGGWIYVRRAKR